MSKKIVVAFITIALSVFGCFACGCSQQTPSDVTSGLLSAMQNGDSEKIGKYCNNININYSPADKNNNLTKEQQDVVDDFVNKARDFNYKVVSETVDGDSATVDVEINTYDFGDMFKEAIGEYIGQALGYAFAGYATEEKLTGLFIDIIGEKMEGMTEKNYNKTITFALTKSDNVWKVNEVNDSHFDAITGGLYSVVKNFNA